MRTFALMTILLAFGLTACNSGGSEESEGTEGNEEQAAETPAHDPPDCAQFATVLATCSAEFEAAYAGTETRYGNGDGAEGASNLMTVMDLNTPEGYCNDQWGHMDAGWANRFNACFADTACGPWSACIAPAIGNSM